jgi:hypothetical protein
MSEQGQNAILDAAVGLVETAAGGLVNVISKVDRGGGEAPWAHAKRQDAGKTYLLVILGIGPIAESRRAGIGRQTFADHTLRIEAFTPEGKAPAETDRLFRDVVDAIRRVFRETPSLGLAGVKCQEPPQVVSQDMEDLVDPGGKPLVSCHHLLLELDVREHIHY